MMLSDRQVGGSQSILTLKVPVRATRAERRAEEGIHEF